MWKYKEAPKELQISQVADVSGGYLALIPPVKQNVTLSF